MMLSNVVRKLFWGSTKYERYVSGLVNKPYVASQLSSFFINSKVGQDVPLSPSFISQDTSNPSHSLPLPFFIASFLEKDRIDGPPPIFWKFFIVLSWSLISIDCVDSVMVTVVGSQRDFSPTGICNASLLI